MRHRIIPLACIFTFAALLLAPQPALAVCKGGAPDGVCDPVGGDDCACDDCLKACSGECTLSNPAMCTLEDACTCADCWTDPVCTDPDLSNCKDDSDCDFFAEGCCCADCAGLANCAGFDGDCGTGGVGGAGGGGAGGSAGEGGNGGSGGEGGGTTTPKNEGCGCSTAGLPAPPPAGLGAAGLALVALARRRRQSALAQSALAQKRPGAEGRRAEGSLTRPREIP